MMENHYYGQVLGNANAPFITSYAATANLATNYFAVGHPSLTNYLEVVGGSNFGILNDDSPDWHNTSCVSNLELGQTALTNPRPPTPAPSPASAWTRQHQPWTQPTKARPPSRSTTPRSIPQRPSA